jgi:hypothetical protein
MAEQQKQRPAHSLRMGPLSATVWGNRRESGTMFYSVQLSRSYRDSSDEWQQTNYFNQADLLNLAKLAERAEEWIASRQAQRRRNDVDDAPIEEDKEDLPF